jgi:hypothetical protein
MGQLGLIGVGVYMIGHGMLSLQAPGSFVMIAGGICVIISAFI